MAESLQDLLEKAWRGGRVGYFSALEESRAWALRQVWKDYHKPEYGMHTYIAGKIKKIGGGHPGRAAVLKFFDKVDADPKWFPGKSTQTQFGPSSVITPTNQAIVARSAMAMKERGEEPTYASIVANNPKALINPSTGEVVSKKRVYAILEEHCYDDPDDPNDTWSNQPRLTKKALTETSKRQRLDWATYLKDQGTPGSWYFRNLVWTDICNSILPRSEKRHLEMTLARKGSRGWGSDKSKMDDKNLRGKKEVLKQKSYDSVRVWWAPVLTRGKFHVEILGHDFPGENPAGAAVLAARVRTALNIRFQGSTPPGIVFTDRGQGFFHINGGRITPEYKAALRANGLKAFNGDNAATQPGNLQEVMLHETAVAWIRRRETVTQARQPWTETVEQFGVRMRGIVQHINANYDVENLSRELPDRIQEVIDAEGGRISK